MQFPMLAFFPHMDRNLGMAFVVLCVGAFVLRRLHPREDSGESRAWVPVTALFGAPAFGSAIVLWQGLIVGEDSRSLDDALANLPGVLFIGLIVGLITYAFLSATQRRSPVVNKSQACEATDASEKE